jgi:acyl carrier protein
VFFGGGELELRMIEGRVREVIASVFSLSPEELPARLEPDTVPGWSSLRQVQLMLALEREFGVEVDPSVLPDLVTEQAIVSYVRDVAA